MNHSQDGGLLKMISRTDPVISSIGQVLKNYRTYSYAPPKVDLRYIGVRLELYWNDIGVLSEIDKTVVVSWLFIGAGNTTCVTFSYLRRKFSIGYRVRFFIIH